MEMKTEKYTREACLWASLQVKARASQVNQKRANDINSSGKAQKKSTGAVGHHILNEKPSWYSYVQLKLEKSYECLQNIL